MEFSDERERGGDRAGATKSSVERFSAAFPRRIISAVDPRAVIKSFFLPASFCFTPRVCDIARAPVRVPISSVGLISRDREIRGARCVSVPVMTRADGQRAN